MAGGWNTYEIQIRGQLTENECVCVCVCAHLCVCMICAEVAERALPLKNESSCVIRTGYRRNLYADAGAGADADAGAGADADADTDTDTDRQKDTE